MSRSTIDYGIDLGTTNSAIAYMSNVVPEIIKNNEDHDVTPSAVFIGKNGISQVGERAKAKILSDPYDGYTEFKRLMGTENSLSFRSAGLSKKPEDLSAEVLKRLKAAVFEKHQEDIQSAVITVPAAFELHQCDATRKAAELAGLKNSPLLQEPVAAALAYGFQADLERSYWLVYDFGGGTFDAAVIKAEDGIINVVHHGGDNFLGGSDIDWAIIEKIVIPKLVKNYNLSNFSRGNNKWEKAFRLIKRSVENAKIDLTGKDSSFLDDCRFEDDDGNQIDSDIITINKSEVISIAEPIILKSIDICRRVLADKGLDASAIDRIILVGGPTKASYFRDIVRDSLGIKIDHSLDPLTVVAKGAAVFAGTQKLNTGKKSKPTESGLYSIDLKYKPVGHESDPTIGGKVLASDDTTFEGFTIEFVNNQSFWRSGRIPLRADGVFVGNLFAEKGSRNVFSIELYDPSGSKKNTDPQSVNYTIGSVIEEQPLLKSVGVALANNEWDIFLKSGQGLPVEYRSPRPYRTVKAIKNGEAEASLFIPIVEGDNEKADRNRLVGTFAITGNIITRDLPAGSEIEIKLKANESRIIELGVYIPHLDEDFTHTFDMRRASLSNDDINTEFKKEIERCNELIEKAGSSNADKVKSDLQDLKSGSLVSEIRSGISAAKSDPAASEKVEKQILELKIRIDELEDLIAWPNIVKEAETAYNDLERLVNQYGTIEQKEAASSIKKGVDSAIQSQNADQVKKKTDEANALYYSILFAMPSFWVNQFQNLQGMKNNMIDKDKAARLFEMGQKYLSQNNIEGLKQIVRQIYDIMPSEVANQVQRGYNAGIVR